MARSILDIIDHTESLKLSGILLFIDFEKAFDSIEWDFLYQSLEAFNFGPTLIRWIKTFYNRPLQKRERTGKGYGCFPFA